MADNPTPDKVQAPGVVSPATGPNAAPATDKPAAGQPDLAATVSEMKGRLTELGEANEKLGQTLLNQRRLEQKRDGTIHQLRQFQQGVLDQARGGYIDLSQYAGTPSSTGQDQPTTQPQAAIGQDNDTFEMMRWKVDHPGWDKRWPEVEKTLYDPVLGPKYASLTRAIGRNGEQITVPDVYGTLDNINGYLEGNERDAKHKSELEERDAKIAELEKAELNRNRTGLNRMAHISGTPAAGTDQAMPDFMRPDGTPMSSDEMTVEAHKRGLIEIDPNDPPKVLRDQIKR